MAKINFNKLSLKSFEDKKTVKFNDLELEIIQYLPQQKKADLLSFVLDYAIDLNTNTFSSIRTETYFVIGLAKYYADVAFTDKQLSNAPQVYDAMHQSGFIELLFNNIPREETDYIQELIEDTIDEISRYNHSIAGMVANMSANAGSMDTSLTEILDKIKNKEGIEYLSELKNIVG